MPIRITGMNSGLDTEAIVSALVSSYSTKVDKYKKAQTKLSWQQDAWKNVNSKVYSLYSSIDKLRFSSAYVKKTTSVSDTTKAKITAGSNAVNGTQTLQINKLAKAGYLTGGNLSSKSGKELTEKAALSDLVSENTDGTTNEYAGGRIFVKANGKETAIDLSADMTANQLVNKLKDAGVNASFDAKNGRFFVSSSDSGKSNEFSISAGDANGLASLKSLGLFVGNDAAANAQYNEWAKYAGKDASDPELKNLLDAEYAKKAVSMKDRANAYVSAYNSAKKVIDGLDSTYGNHATLTADLTAKKSELDTWKAANDATYLKEAKDADGNPIPILDEDGNPTGKFKEEYDIAKMKEDGVYDDYKKLTDDIKKMEAADKSYKTQEGILTANADYVGLDTDGKAVSALEDETSAAYTNVKTVVDEANAEIRKQTDAATMARINDSKAIVDGMSSSKAIKGVVRVEGQDAEIKLNGATFTGSNNTFNINGLTIEATAETNGQEISITTSNDTQGTYDMIKDFIKQYNNVINELTSLYNADSAKGYEPLTEDEKSAMSDTQVEKWEQKIKDSLLRRDQTLDTIMSTLKNSMSKVYEVNGKKYSLSTFGISTLGVLNAEKNKGNAYHIDGDEDDKVSGANADKLMAAIASDPDSVADFFKQLTDGLYKSIDSKMKSTTLRSAYTLYNDKEMASEYSDYTKTIKKWEDKVASMEDRYFKQFSAMEKALASLNSQTSSLTSMMG